MPSELREGWEFTEAEYLRKSAHLIMAVPGLSWGSCRNGGVCLYIRPHFQVMHPGPESSTEEKENTQPQVTK